MLTVLRHPALHFLLLGGVLFGAERLWIEPSQPRSPIVISTADLEQLATDWQRETGREPNDAERRASLHHHVQQQRLLKEALRLGLPGSDPVVRERLIGNLRFLDPGTPRSDARLFRDALALGMAEQDLVARRRLIQRMSQQLTGDIAVDPAAVQRFIEQHPDRYGQPARYRLTQVFIANDATPERAHRLRDALVDGDVRPDDAGDPFLLAALPAWVSQPELARLLGPEVAKALPHLATGEWSSPLQSAWGWHLIRVEARQAAGNAISSDLRRRATYAWLAEREQTLLQQALQTLAVRYPVEGQALAQAADR